MHQCDGRRDSRFQRLLAPLAMQMHLLLGLVLLLILFHLLIPVERRVSPTRASLSPPSRMRRVSPIQAYEVPESPVVPEASLPPFTANDAELVPPSKGETATNVEPEAFGGGPIDLPLLPLYLDHMPDIFGTER